MQFTTPSTKEHTMKRLATTLFAALLLALAVTAVASAKTSPRGLYHGGAHMAHLGHHHLAV